MTLPSDSLLSCQFCQRSFSSTSQLRRHNNTCQSVPIYFNCDDCSYRSRTLMGFTQHRDRDHKEPNEYRCDQCSYATNLMGQLKIHAICHNEEKSAAKIVICDICGVQLRSIISLQVHLRFRHEEGYSHESFECDHCIKTFRDRGTLERHIVSQHLRPIILQSQEEREKFRKYHCHTCDFATSGKQMLARHVFIHETEKINQCSLCNFTAKHSSDTEVHFKKVHKRKQTESRFICDKCGEDVANRPNMAQHLFMKHAGTISMDGTLKIRRHEAKRRKRVRLSFFCDHCGKRYWRPTPLANHMAVSHGFTSLTAQFPCQLCLDVRSTEAALKNHMKRMHKDASPDPQRYTCTYCKASFQLKQEWKNHLKSNHSSFLLQCDECQEAMMDPYKLAHHLRTFHAERFGQKTMTKRKYGLLKKS